MAASLTIEILTDVAKAVKGIDDVDKKTKSMGDTLKGAAGIIAGAVSTKEIIGWGKEWLAAGMDANGAIKNVKIAFGEAATDVIAWGDTASSTFGTTAADAEKMAATVGIALEGYGVSQKDAAKMSEALVQRSSDIAKVYGTDTETVLSKVSSAMRGRTQGLKDYGVQIDKGSDKTAIFNGFMSQTEEMAGRSDTTMGTYHATMGDLSATLGQALVPVLMTVMPMFQWIADWAKNNHTAFVAIVLVIAALALIFSVAATAAGIFAAASLAALWPILLVVAGIAALIAIIIIVCKNWDTLVGWYHTATDAISGVTSAIGNFFTAIGGVAWGVIEAGLSGFAKAWDTVKTAVDKVYDAIKKVSDFIGSVADKVGNFLSKIPGVGAILGKSAPAPGPASSAYGVSAYAAPVTFAPVINISGDIGDPTLAGRRIVAALESWSATNGRRRIAALVAP